MPPTEEVEQQVFSQLKGRVHFELLPQECKARLHSDSDASSFTRLLTGAASGQALTDWITAQGIIAMYSPCCQLAPPSLQPQSDGCSGMSPPQPPSCHTVAHRTFFRRSGYVDASLNVWPKQKDHCHFCWQRTLVMPRHRLQRAEHRYSSL